MGQISMPLPTGHVTDSYKIYLSVNIIDDTDGITLYKLPYPVTVYPNDNLTYSIMETLIETNSVVNSTNMTYTSITNNNTTKTRTTNRILLELNSGNLNLIAKNVVILAAAFNTMSTESSSLSSDKLDKMKNLRESLVNTIAQLSVSDVSSMKVILSALSVATKNTTQISKSMAVSVRHR